MHTFHIYRRTDKHIDTASSIPQPHTPELSHIDLYFRLFVGYFKHMNQGHLTRPTTFSKNILLILYFIMPKVIAT